jgi:anaerobic magnesium-protoporphyrin IX monomethyl ester cyclase
MKILLIEPVPPAATWPRGTFRSRWVPSGLASIGEALLRAGHEVRVLCAEELVIKAGEDRAAADAAMRRTIEEFRPDIAGISLVTPHVPTAEGLARHIKESSAGRTLVVVGGPHVSALPERTLTDCADFDVAAVGEGEQTMVELAQRGPREDVDGIVLRKNGVLVRTAPRQPTHDLDALGEPAYELFDMAHYAARDRYLIRWLPLCATNIRTSRGCTNRCRFCGGHLVSGVGMRYHSIEFIIALLRRVVEKFGLEAIRFEDDTLGGDRERLLEMCEAMRRADLPGRIVWDGCLRADQADPEVLAAMRSAGCIQVEYGFESGADDSLKRLGKQSSAELNRRAVRLTREAGLRVFADIMVGLPGETERDFDATVRFVQWARPEVLSPAWMAPLPGTAVYDALEPAVRERLDWAAFSYFDESGPKVNLTAMPDEVFLDRYRRFMYYVARPLMSYQLLRDSAPDEMELRRNLRRRVRLFALHHPLRAARLFR